MRKLLPYEHQLIRELGITKEEYLDFVQAQFDYTKSPEEKLQEARAGVGVVALVLTIVGTLAQVAATLLAPKPEIPSIKNQRQSREERFSPRFGFNSAQELAKYGDPVNLVYCNTSQNSTGGVRVNTSLIWSAVKSFGSSQFMQNLLVVGASNINAVDIQKTAFGQTPIRQFLLQKVWAYYNPNGNVRFSNRLYGDTSDPSLTTSGDIVCRTNISGGWQEGFSQAFSPTTLNRFGVFAPIPINTDIGERDEDGELKFAPLGIRLDDAFVAAYWNGTTRVRVPVGATFRIRFSKIELDETSSLYIATDEQRRALFSAIDAASSYKLGSAKFRVSQGIADSDLYGSAAVVTMECYEEGFCPSEGYNINDWREVDNAAEKEIVTLQKRISDIDTLLLNPPPIYAPITITNRDISGQLASVTATKQQLNDWIEDVRGFRRARKTDGIRDSRLFVEGLAYAAELSDPVVQEIALNILQLEDELDDIPSDNKAKRRTKKKAIKDAERELDQALNEYGLVNGFVVSPENGAAVSGREEIKRLKRAIAAKDNEAWAAILGAVSVSGGGRDFIAEQLRNAELASERAASVDRIAELKSLIDSPNRWNDNFFMKCLVKFEEASYETINSCRVVNFSLKAKVFQRIQGRAKRYGETEVDGYKASDNGTKNRAALFWVWYRQAGQTTYQRVTTVFAIRRGADNDSFVDLQFVAADNSKKWQFKFEPIADTGAEYNEFGNANYAYIENNGALRTITNPDGTKFHFTGSLKDSKPYLRPPINRTPKGVDEWGLFSNRSDTQITYSFEPGPEITISAVTEQQVEALSNYPRLYDQLSLLGFNAYSGQGMQDLRSISVYVTQGKLVRTLGDDGSVSATANTASSYAPEIFLDTILDSVDGIGRYAKLAGVDTVALAKAKRFCQRNNLFFDGIVADRSSWRQFWAEVAPYSLLEFGRIGGKETLLPAVPTDSAGNIIRMVPISAMFTPGNILEDSYKEEFIDYGSSSQDLIASVIYRETSNDDAFPRNRSVEVSLLGVTEAAAVRQTFDLSDYVTNRAQAILFGKLLCQQRRHIRRNIEFSTFPTDSPLSPGAYIYVDVGQQDWQGIYSGQVEAGGTLNIPLAETVPAGTYSVLLYRSGQAVVSTTASISGNTAASLAGYEGWLFVLGTAVRSKRVFRIVEVQMDEEGEVNVKATEHPCDSSGQSLIADFGDGLFTIR